MHYQEVMNMPLTIEVKKEGTSVHVLGQDDILFGDAIVGSGDEPFEINETGRHALVRKDEDNTKGVDDGYSMFPSTTAYDIELSNRATINGVAIEEGESVDDDGVIFLFQSPVENFTQDREA